jgi:hypothetical protein
MNVLGNGDEEFREPDRVGNKDIGWPMVDSGLLNAQPEGLFGRYVSCHRKEVC